MHHLCVAHIQEPVVHRMRTWGLGTNVNQNIGDASTTLAVSPFAKHLQAAQEGLVLLGGPGDALAVLIAHA